MVFVCVFIVYSAMARYIPKIPKPTSSKEELEQALQLHDAMALARDAEESLVTILKIFRNELVPWPSIHDLGFEAGEFERAQESLSGANLGNLTRDLSTWIVEHYYHPKTLAEVKHLNSGLYQGGLECLLRCVLEQENERLRDREYNFLASTIEDWIKFIWESDQKELMHALEKDSVFTTGQLIGWLDESRSASGEGSLEPVIERLKHQAP
jgi:hypothetical protein